MGRRTGALHGRPRLPNRPGGRDSPDRRSVPPRRAPRILSRRDAALPANGLVDTSRTVFWATGTKEEATGFLCDIAAALATSRSIASRSKSACSVLRRSRPEAEARSRDCSRSAAGSRLRARGLPRARAPRPRAGRGRRLGAGAIHSRQCRRLDDVRASRRLCAAAPGGRAIPAAADRRATPGSGCPPISRTGREAWPSGT